MLVVVVVAIVVAVILIVFVSDWWDRHPDQRPKLPPLWVSSRSTAGVEVEDVQGETDAVARHPSES